MSPLKTCNKRCLPQARAKTRNHQKMLACQKMKKVGQQLNLKRRRPTGPKKVHVDPPEEKLDVPCEDLQQETPPTSKNFKKKSSKAAGMLKGKKIVGQQPNTKPRKSSIEDNVPQAPRAKVYYNVFLSK